MPFEIVYGDLLDQNTEAIVIPLVPYSGPSSKYSKIAYERAGHDALLQARRILPIMVDGECGMTEGFGLFANYVFHARVSEWFGGGEGERKTLTHCFTNALRIAAQNDIKSISFPLLGVGSNRVPPKEAYVIARDAICGYIRAHDLTLNAYLVIHPSIYPDIKELCDEVSVKPEIFEDTLSKRDVSPQEKFHAYLERIENESQIAELMSCSASTVNRIRKYQYKRAPHKSTVIMLAIAIGLSKKERHDFINCIYSPYPFNEQDELIEQLLEQGYTNINKLNIELEKKNPEWILTHKSKGDVLPKMDKRKNKKQYELNL